MPEEQPHMKPVNVFFDMLKKHLENTDYHLVINNLVLLRNILTQAKDASAFDDKENSAVSKIEALWADLNKGCSCTKNKRTQQAIKTTNEFVFSDLGKSCFQKIKSFYKLNSLKIDIPEPVIKCDI